MHSSKMRTVRCSGCRGVCLGGWCLLRCLTGGGCLTKGVSAWRGCVCPSACWDTHTHPYVADGNNKLLFKPLLPVGEKEGGKRAPDEDGGGDDEGAGTDPAAERGAREEPDAVLPGVSETQNSVQIWTLITHTSTLNTKLNTHYEPSNSNLRANLTHLYTHHTPLHSISTSSELIITLQFHTSVQTSALNTNLNTHHTYIYTQYQLQNSS